MTDPHDERDPRLVELLSDAVSDVEPDEALDSIRNRTKVTPMSTRRPWLFAVSGAAVATAAVITAIAMAGGSLTGTTDDPGPVGQSSTPAEPTPTEDSAEPSPTPSEPSEPAASQVVPVYFVGDTPQGPRLYREFQTDQEGVDPIYYAAAATVAGRADDPDYRTLWPSGAEVTQVAFDGTDQIDVSISGVPRELPAGMSDEEAGLAVQQVVYSVQAALGQGRVGVQLLLDGERSDQVLGQPTSEPLTNAPVLETLSLMSITSPTEGEVVSGQFEASGVNNGFEATVAWKVLRGDEVVAQDAGIADGWMAEKLFPWTVPVDVSDLAPGEYTFVASNDDPSGGEEGAGPHTDTRTIVVE